MSLTPVERAVLVDLLVYDDDRAGNIADRCGFHRNSLTNRLPDMVEDGLVENKGGGVYRLTETGRKRAIGLIRAGERPWEE